MHGQTSLEFMVMVVPILLVFVVTIFIYGEHVQEASQAKRLMEASSICLQASSAISSLASLPSGSSRTLGLPRYLDGANYSAYVSAQQRLLKVNYGNRGVGCRLPMLNITNSEGGQIFLLQRNATMRNDNGVLVVEP